MKIKALGYDAKQCLRFEMLAPLLDHLTTSSNIVVGSLASQTALERHHCRLYHCAVSAIIVWVKYWVV